MNIAHHHQAPETGDAQGRAGAGFADLPLPDALRQIDWTALRSRLFAGRDQTGMGGAPAAARLLLRGSFAGGAASTLTTYPAALNFVNLDGSSNGKSGERNTPPVVVEERDERGQR